MEIRYTQGDHQIGDVVCMVLDQDIKGMVTGIQFRDGGYQYMVTFIVNEIPQEYHIRPIEIKKAK